MSDYIFFYNEKAEYGCFSNFYPCEFDYAGRHYQSSEQYIMAQKALAFWDNDAFFEILKSEPKTAKAIGKKVKKYSDKVWSAIRPQVVRRGIRAKFQQNDDLRKCLLDTGDKILVEAAPHDSIWGIGMDATDPDITVPSKWKGQNLLGKTLMRVRADLRAWQQGNSIEYADAGDACIDFYNGGILNMPVTAVLQHPVAKEIISTYFICLEYLLNERGDSKELFKSVCDEGTINDLNFSMRTNMGGGLPCCGFYEMYQDLYDAMRFGQL